VTALLNLSSIDAEDSWDEEEPLTKLNRQSIVDWTRLVSEADVDDLTAHHEQGVKLLEQYINDEITYEDLYRELYFLINEEQFEA
jgi:hypothetical protein